MRGFRASKACVACLMSATCCGSHSLSLTSHSADRTASLVVRHNSCWESTAPILPTLRALVGFAHAAAGSVTLSVLQKEVRNFADTVYSLTPAQRSLYGPRIVLFIFAPANVVRR